MLEQKASATIADRPSMSLANHSGVRSMQIDVYQVMSPTVVLPSSRCEMPV